ncbi:MAG: hypothetical protein IJK62_01445 [Bacteroidales bacterium]|nr:hypothetical protein [Bacteroidales bacterium]
MKDKESKRFSFAHICAYLSLVISVTMIVLWCCNAGGFKVVSLDSFVGVIVALLAIVVTLVLGWQIYNSIEIKDKLKKVDDIESKAKEQDKEIRQNLNWSQHLIFIGLAEIEINKQNYTLAFSYLMESLEYSLSSDNIKNHKQLLSKMEIIIESIKENTPCAYMKKINNSDTKIKASQLYKNIKPRYEKIYNDFISKVKDDKNE